MGQILQVCSDLDVFNTAPAPAPGEEVGKRSPHHLPTKQVIDYSAARPTDLIQSSSGVFHKLTIVKLLDWNSWPRNSTFKGRPHFNSCTLVSTTHCDRISEDIGLESLATEQDSTFKSHPHSNVFNVRYNRWIFYNI